MKAAWRVGVFNIFSSANAIREEQVTKNWCGWIPPLAVGLEWSIGGQTASAADTTRV